MSVKELEKQVKHLTPRQLDSFGQWFEQYRDAASSPGEEAGDDLTERQKIEIRRRRDELIANPGLSQPVTDEMFERLKRKLAHARPRKTSAR